MPVAGIVLEGREIRGYPPLPRSRERTGPGIDPEIAQKTWELICSSGGEYPALSAKNPFLPLPIGPGHGKISGAWGTGIRWSLSIRRKQRHGNAAKIIRRFRGWNRIGNPIPVVVLAIDDDGVNVGDGNAGIEEVVAAEPQVTCCRQKCEHVVNAAVCHLRRKCKSGIPGNEKIVAPVILQFH